MDLGKAWLTIELDTTDGSRRFISVLSPRKGTEFIKTYIEQLYVDQNAALDGKISYKNSPRNWPYRAYIRNGYSGTVYCGRDPLLIAYFCTKLKKTGGVLQYTYTSASKKPGMKKPDFTQQTLEVPYS